MEITIKGDGIDQKVQIDPTAAEQFKAIGDGSAQVYISAEVNKGKIGVMTISISKELDKTSDVRYTFDKDKPVMISDIRVR